MESFLEKYHFYKILRNFNSIRNQYLDFCISRRSPLSFIITPIFAFLSNYEISTETLFHVILLVVCLLLLVFLFSYFGKITLLVMHSVFMTIGVIIFLAEGVVSYRNQCMFQMLSPIMQGSRSNKLLSIHKTLNIIAATFIGSGFLLILCHKMKNEFTLLPSMSLHSVVAVLAIISLVLLSIYSTSSIPLTPTPSSFRHVISSPTSSSAPPPTQTQQRIYRRRHKVMGLILWDLMMLAMTLGFWSIFPISFIQLVTISYVLCVWALVHFQMRRKSEEKSDDLDSDSCDDDDEGDPESRKLVTAYSQEEQERLVSLKHNSSDESLLIAGNLNEQFQGTQSDEGEVEI